MTTVTKEEAKELIPFTKSSLPILEFNFDDIKKELTAEMAKYSGIVVTLETLKADKALAKKLKAKGKSFNDQRLEKVKAISAPIVTFTDQMAELTQICTDSSELISNQVKVFEAETLVDIEVLLIDALNESRKAALIDVKYKDVKAHKPLVKLGAVTGKGALNKAAKDRIAAIVASELSLQQKVKYRLLQLESESHKAGLDTPLNEISVESILMISCDNDYTVSLARIITAELERQNERKEKELLSETVSGDGSGDALPEVDSDESAGVKERLADRFGSPEFDGYNASEDTNLLHGSGINSCTQGDFRNATANEYDDYADSMMQEQSQHQPEPQIQLKDGHVMCIATATFKVSVPHQVTEEQIQKKIIKMMSDAGIDSLDTVQVRKL